VNRLSWSALVFVAVTLVSSAALACPVCGTAKAENDWAFGVTTLLLSFMPPLMFIGGVVYLVRAHKKAARRELADELAAAARTPSISTPD
jgi:hypothetical protein